jgi:YjjG family noncanonical pyrimidine nucleotidase
MKYPYLLFDIDGTLMDYEKSAEAALEKCMLAERLPGDPAAAYPVYKAINLSLWEAYERHEIDLDHLKTQRFQLLAEEMNWTFARPRDLNDEYLELLSQEAHLFPGVQDTLEILKKRGHALGLITNGLSAVQRPRLEKSGLSSFFEFLIISQEHNCAKPHAEIFDIATRSSGYSKTQTLVIGDSVTSDMAGARNAGIDFCWITADGRAVDSELTYKFKLKSVAELLDLVDRL